MLNPQPNADPELVKKTIDEMAASTTMLYPSFLVVGFFMTAGLSILLIRAFSARLGRLPAIRGFVWFRVPEFFIWGAIAGGFGLVAGTFYTLPVLDVLAKNLLVVVLSLYFVQGLAISHHFMDRLKLGMIIRVLFYLLLPFTGVAILAMGVFDLWGNFRAPRQNDENL